MIHKFSCNSKFQEEALASTFRNQCYSGGYGNGKSTVGAKKIETLSSTFPKYRSAILRRSSTDLKRTTMETFFKWCPPELYDDKEGGARVDSRNYLRFINGSEIYWLHLDSGDAASVARGLEVNSIFIDQAEEIMEEDFDHMNARVGRWDRAEVPKWLEGKMELDNLGRPIIPAYMILAVNPDSFEHWVYRRFHEDSDEHNAFRMIPDVRDRSKKVKYSYSMNYKMYHGSSTENEALSEDNLSNMLQKDDAFVQRFVYGKWGIPEGAVHTVHPESILEDIPIEVLDKFIVQGTLYRAFDHGYSDPTCCLWFAVYRDWILCYREYYQAGEFISEHRKNIVQMSNFAGMAEEYRANIADPDIFKKRSEKFGQMWSVADEYQNTSGPLSGVPAIHWKPGDNNEFLTRNQINELLAPKKDVRHPVTDEPNSPSLYFLRRSEAFPDGCEKAISQLKSQKRKQVSVINGRPIFSDERDEKLPDHAYDPLRYFVATRPKSTAFRDRAARPGSFDYQADRANRLVIAGKVAHQSMLPAHAIRHNNG